MNKKLPKIFANKLSTKTDNNERVIKTNFTEKEIVREAETRASSGTIEQKINQIFNSPKFIYKIQVDIETIDGVTSKTLVGKNKTHLITMDNELIALKDILNIRAHE